MAEQSNLTQANANVFERLLDWFPDSIQSVNAQGNLVYVNRKVTELLGYSRKELLGMHISQLYAPELMKQVNAGFEQLRRQGSLSVMESIVLDREGRRIPVEIRSFAVYDDQSEFLRTFSILRDLREMKRLQDNLMHASRLAALGELAASITHDIGNPLAVIKVSGELLHCELERLATTNKDQAGALQSSLAYVDRAAGKIERLVTHLRNLASATTEERELVDLAQTLEGALFMTNSKIKRGHVNLTINTPENTPLILGHSMQIEQVFMNLVSNACDAVRSCRDPRIEISIRETRLNDGMAWECLVADNGPGIALEDQERVFNSFFTTKDKNEGSGLGLAIVRSIVHDHSGTVGMTSHPGSGAAFRILLPAAGNE